YRNGGIMIGEIEDDRCRLWRIEEITGHTCAPEVVARALDPVGGVVRTLLADQWEQLMDPWPLQHAVDRIGVMSVHLFAVSAERRRGVTHRCEQAGLSVEEQARVEELGDLRGGQLLPATGKRLQVNTVGLEDHLDLQQYPALLEIHLGVQARSE